MGVGDAVQNSKVLDNAVERIRINHWSKTLVTKSKKSVATFRLREGMPIGAKVTLRGERMYEFLDKLIKFHYLVYVTSKVFLKQHSMVVVTTL